MVVTGIAGVVAGIAVFVIVANLVRSTSSPSSLATATFDVGRANDRAETIAKGGPILFRDLLGRSRDIYVQHLGGDDWRAFDARSPADPTRCFLEWDGPGRQFRDRCSQATYAPDGTGLVSYRTVVEDGRVRVDLRSPISPGEPLTAPSAPPTT